MRLRNLFEALGQEVAIIFGRFNPPHKGHRAAWELASKSPIWYVGTNQSTVGPKDPLPFDVKVEAMKTVWPEVEGHVISETSWLTLASMVYEKHGDITLLCLTDEDWVTKTIQQYNGKEGAHGFYNFKKIEQKPTPRLSSATALRDAVSKGDREAFTQAAGVSADTEVAGKPFFDLVAEYLLPYSNAPKKAVKKKVAEPVEGIEEGWSDAVLARRTGGPRTPYSVYIKGKKWKDFENDDHAEAVANKLKAKFKADGRDPSVITIAPTDIPEGMAEGESALEKFRKGSAEREKKHDAAEKEMRARHARGEEDMKGSIDRLEKHVNAKEDAAGVGIITKQNTTKDVNKGTPRKNLKAFRLI